MGTRAQYYRELAHNLIETLGPQRAAHVAEQYGWYDVVQEIAQARRELADPPLLRVREASF